MKLGQKRNIFCSKVPFPMKNYTLGWCHLKVRETLDFARSCIQHDMSSWAPSGEAGPAICKLNWTFNKKVPCAILQRLEARLEPTGTIKWWSRKKFSWWSLPRWSYHHGWTLPPPKKRCALFPERDMFLSAIKVTIICAECMHHNLIVVMVLSVGKNSPQTGPYEFVFTNSSSLKPPKCRYP